MNPGARLLTTNAEMVPALLVERIVARLSAVPLTAIADRTLSADQFDRVQVALTALKPVADRLAFLQAPFSLEHVAAAGDAFGASVLVIDYIQMFTVAGVADPRERLETAATVLRRFCDAGAALLVASAVSRQKSATGSTYAGLGLASFRGSSELEFGCDSAYVLVPTEGGGINFQCEKNRYGAVADIPTEFDPATQTFRPAKSGLNGLYAAAPARPRTSKAKGGTTCDA